jgi:endonuclease/exonuclease/phosphatase family metal-dependent hydrolase
MIAEVLKTFRVLSRPMRRQFWWPEKHIEATERPGVVLVSLDDLKEWERRPLLKALAHYKLQPLANHCLPRDQVDEHLEPDPPWASWYRAFILFAKTWSSAWRLLSGRTSLAQHLCESDDLARLHIRVLNGKCFCHIGTLHTKRVQTIKRIERFLRGHERRPYELWIVMRQQNQALLPAYLPLPEEPLTVEEVVEMAVRRPNFEPETQTAKRVPKPPGVLRIMSYNVHSGFGLDGRLSLRRIAEVLHQYDPDFVALQELDVGCKRSERKHQLEELQKLWPSDGGFLPLVRMRGGRYGIGFLSRLPVLEATPLILPTAEQILPQEARGVQKVTVSLANGSQMDIFNTHLGLTLKERRAQLKGLLKLEFDSSRAQVLTGDFNCGSSSKEYRLISRSWQPTQANPLKTWFGTFPVRHLDYCFFRGDLSVEQTIVPRDTLTRLASDHLPLITDFKLPIE